MRHVPHRLMGSGSWALSRGVEVVSRDKRGWTLHRGSDTSKLQASMSPIVSRVLVDHGPNVNEGMPIIGLSCTFQLGMDTWRP